MKNKLFPDLQPVSQGLLEVDGGHVIHWETSGNPAGVPVVWLHGGPGSSASPLHRKLFDPERFWIVQFDQRGCGKSLPSGGISNNQTKDLVEDIEALRKFLGLEQWSVVGGSWGGALALAYAQAHPEVIRKMLLRSTFLCSEREVTAFLQNPPDCCQAVWRPLKSLAESLGDEGLLQAGHRVFCQEQKPEEQAALALAWGRFESAMNAYPLLAPAFNIVSGEPLIHRYRVQCHYLAHACFTSPADLLAPHALANIEATLIHGLSDVVCPAANSLKIQAVMPLAKLRMIEACGHDLTHPAMIEAMLDELAGW